MHAMCCNFIRPVLGTAPLHESMPKTVSFRAYLSLFNRQTRGIWLNVINTQGPFLQPLVVGLDISRAEGSRLVSTLPAGGGAKAGVGVAGAEQGSSLLRAHRRLARRGGRPVVQSLSSSPLTGRQDLR